MLKYLISVFFGVFLVSCGYRPVSHIAQDLIGNNIYVSVIINEREPKNSVWIKDAVYLGLTSRLNKNVVSDEKMADTKVEVSIKSLRYEASIFDQFGYITAYRAILALNYKLELKDGSVYNIPVSGEHDFVVAKRLKSTRYADSILSDTQRYEAINEASKEAFDEFVSILALKGLRGK